MLPVENDLRTFPQFPICIHHLIFTKLESLMCSRGRHTYNEANVKPQHLRGELTLHKKEVLA